MLQRDAREETKDREGTGGGRGGRLDRRVPYGAWVEGVDEGTPSFYLAQSLSLHGLKLLAANDHAPRVGEPVRLRLLVENETRVMAILGKVVNSPHRVQEGEDASFSIHFTELDEDHRLFLTDLYDEACGF